LRAAVEAVVVFVFTIQVPVASHSDPSGTSPPSVDTVAVLVTADSLVATSPEPTRSLVVVVFLPQLPNTSDTTPFALVIAEEVSASIAVNADTTVVVGPTPLRATVKAMIVPVPAVKMPVASHIYPARASPLAQQSVAVLMPANTLVSASPEVPGRLVVMVALPQVPIGSDIAPLSLIIALENAPTIPMHTNALVTSPTPALPSMKAVVVVVALVEMPVRTNLVPACAIPAPENAQAIEVTPDSACATPEPPAWFEVFVTTIEVPISTNILPTTLIVAVEAAMPIKVHTNAFIATPTPLGATMQAMIVFVTAVEFPVTAAISPLRAIPSPICAPAVLVPTDTFPLTAVTTPAPLRSLVVVVAAPQVPV
jgi:hypothetical protein